MVIKINPMKSPGCLAVGGVLVILTCTATSLTPRPAFAITAELAKKCETVVSTAFPPRQVGNPAAGSAKGNSKAQREYYKKCVANDGKVDEGGGHPR
ncbi:MAG: hypothetical protein JWQ94_131 [Tardiphaga sp.]|jgi:hypothetical protein|nr:hypothetical protein [Tardiphaga sp.]